MGPIFVKNDVISSNREMVISSGGTATQFVSTNAINWLCAQRVVYLINLVFINDFDNASLTYMDGRVILDHYNSKVLCIELLPCSRVELPLEKLHVILYLRMNVSLRIMIEIEWKCVNFGDMNSCICSIWT